MMSDPPLPRRARPRTRACHTRRSACGPCQRLNVALFRRCFALRDVGNEPTVISAPGTRAPWLREALGVEPSPRTLALFDKISGT